MSDYISREAFLEYLRKDPFDLVDRFGLPGVIERFPASDVAPVVHGKWIQMNGHRYCNVCGHKDSPILTNYCPNCGAKMDGGDHDADG